VPVYNLINDSCKNLTHLDSLYVYQSVYLNQQPHTNPSAGYYGRLTGRKNSGKLINFKNYILDELFNGTELHIIAKSINFSQFLGKQCSKVGF